MCITWCNDFGIFIAPYKRARKERLRIVKDPGHEINSNYNILNMLFYHLD